MSIRSALLMSLLVVNILVPTQAKDKPPNILFIYTDDHSYRTVSCTGIMVRFIIKGDD